MNQMYKLARSNLRPKMHSRRDFLLASAAFSVAASRWVDATPSPAQTIPSQEVQAQAAALSSVDQIARNFLIHSGVGAAQIAIGQKGTLLFTHAYATNPPSGFERVNTQTLFRIASCSKLFTCAAIDTLHKNGKLQMDQKAFSILDIHAPAKSREKPDPRIDEITIRHLLDHAGGWNDHESVTARDGTHIPGTEWDPVFGVRKIALDLGLHLPPTKLEIARYMYGKPLQFAPGSQDLGTTHGKSYSNFGYLLLGLIIESVSGKPYIEYIRTALGPESDTSNVYLSRLNGAPRNPREVWYVDPGMEPTALDPRSSTTVPSAYGGFLPELMDSAGGLMTNAETLARFVARHAVWGLGGRNPGAERSGSLPGTSSYTWSRPNGIDAAFILNTRAFQGGPKSLEDFTASMRSLLDQLG